MPMERRPLPPEKAQALDRVLNRSARANVMIGEVDAPRPPWKLLRIFRRPSDNQAMVLAQCGRCFSYHGFEGRILLDGVRTAICPNCKGSYEINLPGEG